jgi:UDP-N-acetyl-D-galactosamine dehydrogenase
LVLTSTPSAASASSPDHNLYDLKAAQVFVFKVCSAVDQANRPDMTPTIKAGETEVKLHKAEDVVIYESTVYPANT